MRLGVRRQQVGEQRRPGRGAGRHLVVREHPVLAPQPRTVVAPPAGDEFGHRARLGLHDRAR
ncbi:hypothetical protein AQJ84_33385 [Streptomyces resistomycificus]|nr:hypothetical protein AQJ84_33385 [Streptomyces resistomycificus]